MPYENLFNHSLDAVFLAEPNGQILYANPAACELLGYTAEELIAAGRGALLDPADPRLGPALEERERSGRFRGVLTMIRKDGRRFPAEISSTIFTGVDGRRSTTVLVRDVSERERAEAALRAANEALEQALAEVRQLRGTLPICMFCKQIRDQQNYWHAVEAYIAARSEVRFSHGICPHCMTTVVEPQLGGS